MHKVKCRICHGIIDTDSQKDWVMPQDKWYYHQSCYDDFAKKKGALKQKDLTIEADNDLWFSAVYDYLKRDLKMALNFNKFLSQWKSFLKKGMTAKGIYFTLRYFYEVRKGDVSKSENGIGIIPFIYEEGTCYWGERNQKDKGICDRIEAQIHKADAQKKTTILQKEKKKTVSIDLSIIELMEDEDG